MKSTQTAVTGGGNAPRAAWIETPTACYLVGQSDIGNNKGEECIICGKDSWTCEHFDSREEAERNQ